MLTINDTILETEGADMFYVNRETLENGVSRKFGSLGNANISQMAREMGIARQTITRWLYGGYAFEKLDAQLITAWCKYLNCAMTDLIEFRMN